MLYGLQRSLRSEAPVPETAALAWAQLELVTNKLIRRYADAVDYPRCAASAILPGTLFSLELRGYGDRVAYPIFTMTGSREESKLLELDLAIEESFIDDGKKRDICNYQAFDLIQGYVQRNDLDYHQSTGCFVNQHVDGLPPEDFMLAVDQDNEPQIVGLSEMMAVSRLLLASYPLEAHN